MAIVTKSMSNETRGTELKVGLFLLIGIVVVSVMAVKFGKLGQGLQKYYTLTVEFPNASGLLKGAEVYMSGARVGFVEDSPALIEGRYAVKVPVRIRDGIHIPTGSSFTIGSAGFMGDAFVAVDPPANPDLSKLLTDGTYVVGTRLKGFSDIAADGSGVIEELKKRLQELEAPIRSVREGVLGESNVKNLNESIANLKTITTSLNATAKGIDEVVMKAKSAANTLVETMQSAKTAMAKVDGVVKKVDDATSELKPALVGVRKAAESGTKTMDSAKTLITKAGSGQGVLGVLINDKETGDNLKSLIRNMKERGVLWYKDKEKEKR